MPALLDDLSGFGYAPEIVSLASAHTFGS